MNPFAVEYKVISGPAADIVATPRSFSLWFIVANVIVFRFIEYSVIS